MNAQSGRLAKNVRGLLFPRKCHALIFQSTKRMASRKKTNLPFFSISPPKKTTPKSDTRGELQTVFPRVQKAAAPSPPTLTCNSLQLAASTHSSERPSATRASQEGPPRRCARPLVSARKRRGGGRSPSAAPTQLNFLSFFTLRDVMASNGISSAATTCTSPFILSTQLRGRAAFRATRIRVRFGCR